MEINENLINDGTSISKIKSNFILKILFENLKLNRVLKIIIHNKHIQNRLNKGIIDYKNYFQIEIEIIPVNNTEGKFINFNNFKKTDFHIYFNNDTKELKRNTIYKD